MHSLPGMIYFTVLFTTKAFLHKIHKYIHTYIYVCVCMYVCMCIVHQGMYLTDYCMVSFFGNGNFVDFVIFKTSTKFVSLKGNENSTVTCPLWHGHLSIKIIAHIIKVQVLETTIPKSLLAYSNQPISNLT